MNVHFDRPIIAGCLFCHANRFDMNEGRPPVFHGLSIGCERCHGPGELHARRPEVVQGRDWTIVNPADLEPAPSASRSASNAICRGRSDRTSPAKPHSTTALGSRSTGSCGYPSAGRSDSLASGGRARQADAPEPLLPRERGRARVHLLPRPAPASGCRGTRRLLSRPMPGVSRRARLHLAPRPATGPAARRRLHRLPHAPRAGCGYRPHGDHAPHDPAEHPGETLIAPYSAGHAETSKSGRRRPSTVHSSPDPRPASSADQGGLPAEPSLEIVGELLTIGVAAVGSLGQGLHADGGQGSRDLGGDGAG